MAEKRIHCFRIIGLACLFMNIASNNGCLPVIPVDDFIDEDCVVGTVPFGIFNAASGSILSPGDTVMLTCNRGSCPPMATATCINGVITPSVSCSKVYCPSATPLLRDGIPAPGDTQISLTSAGPTLVGDSITASCIRFTGIPAGTIINTNFEDGSVGCQNANNNPLQIFAEQVTLTCTCSGEYQVDMLEGNPGALVPKSGIVSAPQVISCRFALPTPC